MKFHLSTASGNIVTGTGPGWVRIGAQEYRENVVVTRDSIVSGWASGGFEQLAEADFEALAEARPEVLLLGTGSTLRFPAPRLSRALIAAGTGLEVMDTPAACRTYNILVAEGRNVTAALLLR